MLQFAAPEKGRLAKLIAARGVPYGTVRKLLRNRDVKCNGKRVKEDLLCEKGDFIEVYVPAEEAASPPVVPVYADEDVLVLNKPAGVTVEEFSSRIRASYPSARPVHRLDRNTCGVLVFARNAVAEAALLHGFRSRAFEKYYLAEVFGTPVPPRATLTAYLEKVPSESTVYVHDEKRPGDREIRTRYVTLSSRGETSILEVELLTGRTHQIRAHLAHVGHPVVGDGKYGKVAENKRYHAKYQRLQAYKLILHFDENSPLRPLDGKEFTVPREDWS